MKSIFKIYEEIGETSLFILHHVRDSIDEVCGVSFKHPHRQLQANDFSFLIKSVKEND